MGANEKLVPGELLSTLPGLNYRVKQNFKINFQVIAVCLNEKVNEEIAHV